MLPGFPNSGGHTTPPFRQPPSRCRAEVSGGQSVLDLTLRLVGDASVPVWRSNVTRRYLGVRLVSRLLLSAKTDGRVMWGSTNGVASDGLTVQEVMLGGWLGRGRTGGAEAND